MLDKKAKVKEIRALGAANHLLILAAPEQARLVRPGQFVMLKCVEEIDANPLLRRPFSVFDIHSQTRSGKPAGLELLVKDVGAGSHLLSRLKAGQHIWMLGPQGRPFELPSGLTSKLDVACLVAGGVGIAALYLLARNLLEASVSPVLFYGGRTGADLVLRERFEALGIRSFYTTEDGSLGEKGMVTRPLEEFLSRRSGMDTRVYSCGPWGMMKAVHELSAGRRIPCEVSLEARMGCSLGACMGCVVRAVDGSGEEQYLRVCMEGPIMDSRVVDWNTHPL
jgi:dihydroorotate dehydrogenase electron transfer subunit